MCENLKKKSLLSGLKIASLKNRSLFTINEVLFRVFRAIRGKKIKSVHESHEKKTHKFNRHLSKVK